MSDAPTLDHVIIKHIHSDMSTRGQVKAKTGHQQLVKQWRLIPIQALSVPPDNLAFDALRSYAEGMLSTLLCPGWVSKGKGANYA